MTTDVLGFQARNRLLDAVVGALGARPSAALLPGGAGTIYVSAMLPAPVIALADENRRLLTAIRRIVRNAGKRGIRRIVQRVRRLDLVDTRLFISAWRSSIVDAGRVGIAVDLAFTNAAPYALYVHPKRTRKSRTFINTDLPPILNQLADEIATDLRDLFRRTSASLPDVAGFVTDVLTPNRVNPGGRSVPPAPRAPTGPNPSPVAPPRVGTSPRGGRGAASGGVAATRAVQRARRSGNLAARAVDAVLSILNRFGVG